MVNHLAAHTLAYTHRTAPADAMPGRKMKREYTQISFSIYEAMANGSTTVNGGARNHNLPNTERIMIIMIVINTSRVVNWCARDVII